MDKLDDKAFQNVINRKAFSIIIPVYNCEHTIDSFFKHFSLLDENCFEAIFIDDGSTDNTLSLLETKCKTYTNAHIIARSHQGVSAARNAGLKSAQGEYVLFLDCDDYFFPQVFDVLQEVIDENHADIIVFGARVNNYNPRFTLCDIEPRNVIYNEFDAKILFEEVGARPYVWNCAYKLEFLRTNNILFDEDIYLGEDQLFQFTAFPKATKIQFIADKLYCYHYLQYDDSAMHEYLHNCELHLVKHLDLIDKSLCVLQTANIIENVKNQLLGWIYELTNYDFRTLKHTKNYSIRLRKLLKRYKLTAKDWEVCFRTKIRFMSVLYPYLGSVIRFITLFK